MKSVAVLILGICLVVSVHGAGKKNKIGRCPELMDFIMGKKCENPCKSDSDCSGNGKCCLSDCSGNECIAALEETPDTMCRMGCPKILWPVCGTDGDTYSNECILNFTACNRNQQWVKMAYEGECREPGICEEEEGKQHTCAKDLDLYEEQKALIGRYRPQCDDDGFYLAKQCHASIGMCWCASCSGNKLIEPARGRLSEEQCRQMRDKK